VAGLNYTWTIDDTNLYGKEVDDYTFEKAGTYTVSLKVTDKAGNYDEISFDVKVKAAIAKSVTLGPFNDKDGSPLGSGFEVTITVDGTAHTVTTNKDGKATFKNIPQPESSDPVVVKDEDGNEIYSGTYGETTGEVATTYEPSSSFLIYIIIVVIVVVVVVVVVLFLLRKKPEEGELEEEEMMEGEGIEVIKESPGEKPKEKETGDFQCPECGASIYESDEVCLSCGVEFEYEEEEEPVVEEMYLDDEDREDDIDLEADGEGRDDVDVDVDGEVREDDIDVEVDGVEREDDNDEEVDDEELETENSEIERETDTIVDMDGNVEKKESDKDDQKKEIKDDEAKVEIEDMDGEDEKTGDKEDEEESEEETFETKKFSVFLKKIDDVDKEFDDLIDEDVKENGQDGDDLFENLDMDGEEELIETTKEIKPPLPKRDESQEHPLWVLKRRYASGEITVEEYNIMKSNL